MSDFLVFLNQINLNDDATYYEGASFLRTPSFHKKSDQLSLAISVLNPLPIEVYRRLVHRLKKTLKCSVCIEVQFESDFSEELLLDYITEFNQINHQHLVIKVENKQLVGDLNELAACVEFLSMCGFKVSVVEEKRVLQDNPVMEVKAKQKEVVQDTYEDKKKVFTPKPKRNYVAMSIVDINEAMNNLKISGDVFEIELRHIRDDFYVQSVYVNDTSDAICLKRMTGKNLKVDELNELKIGDCINAYGFSEYDTYARDLVFRVDKLEIIKPIKREDNAQEKRIELHLHTKLSEMDGVSEISEYIDQAIAWGHDAIAITDHLVVQDFPKAQRYIERINSKREKPFKMLYGVELNMVDPHLNIVMNPNDDLMENCSYCVFDLETTGLSTSLDEIIEFGACIVENRSIVSKKQMFVKPHQAITPHITKITNITPQLVASAASIEDCIDEILAYIGDRVLVAHNATFDVGMLNEALIKLGRAPLTNPVIDTLPLARIVLSDKTRFNLGAVARAFNVLYDDKVAHRGDYDAEVLANVFIVMFKHFPNYTLNDLQNNQDESVFNKIFPYHVTVLAKNKAGLKSLFELITISHTQHLSYTSKSLTNVVAEPIIFRSEIEERRENLLIGSACVNGEVFETAQTRGLSQLEKVISFYDYIELQPLENYRFKIENGTIVNEERMKAYLLNIEKVALSQNKIIVASGDAHYVDPKSKIVRDVFINSQAIGGKRHPLYTYNSAERLNRVNPDQHFRTTDEMLAAFNWMGEDKAFEYVVTNTHKISDLIEEVKPVYDRLFTPTMENSDQKLRDICFENAYAKYGNPLPEIVEKRLVRELDSIIGHGFYVVYYISHLLVKKSLEDGYMVGSRGSVGSSFVATMANITEVNPLVPHYVCPKCHYVEFFTDDSVASGFDLPDKICPVCGENIRGDGQNIPFETFLGFEGDKVPDIDLNFSGDYQANAHNYLKDVFGEDHVYRAGTIATVAEKTAFGYVSGYQEEMGLRRKKKVSDSEDENGTFAYSEEHPLRRAQELFLAKKCDGVKRSTGQHPGGILVVPNEFDVHDFTPVQFPANNPYADWKTTHFEFHDIHDNLLKFDILGHVDPTAMKLLEEMSGIDPRTIPMNDPDTMAIFSNTESLNIDSTKNTEKTGAAGIPEFGTQFVRGILELTRPTTFDELVRISGLSHGTDVWLNNAKDLIDAGKCTLRNVIGCRDDIMVYLSSKGLPSKLSFTIMESVRKGKGLKPEWIEEMGKFDLDPWYVDSCLKIKYMFPKAHAVAYVMMAVRIAWFKVHHPLYYYCMFFSIRCDAYEIETMVAGESMIRQRMNEITTRLNSNELKGDVSKKEKDIYSTLELSLEMYYRGYRFSNLSLQKSEAKNFIVDDEHPGCIIPPFMSIDGLGENVAIKVIAERKLRPFLSKEDLVDRTSLNGTVIKKMEAMHVLDDLQDENQMALF